MSGDHGWHDHIQSSGSTQPQWWIAHQQHDNVGEATADLHGELTGMECSHSGVAEKYFPGDHRLNMLEYISNAVAT